MKSYKPLSILCLVLLLSLTGCQNSDITVTSENYESIVTKIGMYEALDPLKFLEVKGNYNENFWGDKVKLKG
jgi:hypothetical protein